MTPLTYPWLYTTVRPRFASDAALEAALPQPRTPAQLRQLGDDRYLAAMTRRVFHAGVRQKQGSSFGAFIAGWPGEDIVGLWAAVQRAFNALQQASGRPLCQLSAMLAWSINPVSTQPAP
jgi:hypothetical protein